MSEHDQRVSDLAYRLWEDAGRPEGRSDEFWYIALEQIANHPAESDGAHALPPDPTTVDDNGGSEPAPPTSEDAAALLTNSPLLRKTA